MLVTMVPLDVCCCTYAPCWSQNSVTITFLADAYMWTFFSFGDWNGTGLWLLCLFQTGSSGLSFHLESLSNSGSHYLSVCTTAKVPGRHSCVFQFGSQLFRNQTCTDYTKLQQVVRGTVGWTMTHIQHGSYLVHLNVMVFSNDMFSLLKLPTTLWLCRLGPVQWHIWHYTLIFKLPNPFAHLLQRWDTLL
jgi:hypothetical protein